MYKYHLAIFTLPLGPGAQGTGTNTDILATTIMVKSPLSLTQEYHVFCQYP